MHHILQDLFDDGQDDCLGGASLPHILTLDKVLRQYHRQVAVEQWLDTTRWGWFPTLTAKKPNHGFVRDAVDIIKDFATAKPWHLTYMASEILRDEYLDILIAFDAFLTEGE